MTLSSRNDCRVFPAYLTVYAVQRILVDIASGVVLTRGFLCSRFSKMVKQSSYLARTCLVCLRMNY